MLKSSYDMLDLCLHDKFLKLRFSISSKNSLLYTYL